MARRFLAVVSSPYLAKNPQRKPRGKFFTPVPGFVVKASLARPWAPPPSVVEDNDAGGTSSGRKVVENAPAGTKVFINLCGHEGVSPPIDQARQKSVQTGEVQQC